MKFTEKMQEAINLQINKEMWSANLYTSMAMHFASKGLDGFAHWFRKQAAEEMEHAHDMMNYIVMRGGRVKLMAVAGVPTEFDSELSIVEQAYEHECVVSEHIEELVRIANAEKDMASQDFFWKYIREQVEEEANASALVERVRMAEGHAIMFLDRELAGRK